MLKKSDDIAIEPLERLSTKEPRNFDKLWVGKGVRTHSHTRHIRTNTIQYGDHMSSFGHRALKARIKCIARKKGQQFWLLGILRI